MNRVIAGLMIALVVLAGAGIIYTLRDRGKQGAPTSQPADTPPRPAARATEPPPIRHPIEEATRGTTPPEAPRTPASREEPDATLLAALSVLVPGQSLDRWLVPDQLVRRFVVAVDNLPRERIPSQLTPVRPVPGPFASRSDGGTTTIDPRNYSRYTPAVNVLERVDARRLVATYARFYPLFQSQYEELGYPGRYFNDRVVDAIDSLLATPEPDSPPTLVQPKVLYQFEDPQLEALPAGQKALIRMGPDNSARVKRKLREIRRALTGKGPGGQQE